MTSNTYFIYEENGLSTEVNGSVDIKECLEEIMDDNIPTLPDFNKIVIIEVFVILSKLIVSLITKGPISDSKMQGLPATFHQFSPIG